MKNGFLICFVLMLTMVIAPVTALDFSSFSIKNVKQTFSDSEKDAEIENTAYADSDGSVKVMASASGNIITTTELDYIVGCVACEMPATYHEEALKAQAVAAYTNLLRLRQNPDSSLNGADISDSPAKHQGYYDEQTRREKWGDKYDYYNEKVTAAVSAVIGKAIIYDGKPITAAYCAICPGRTETAANIWGGEIPYLQSVVSSGDKLAPDYSATVVLTAEQFSQKAASDSEIVLSGDPSQWVTDIEATDSGTGVIKTITIGGKALTGTSARTLFSLRSPSFTVKYESGNFTFVVSGYGHCVGMSQYGADYMARQGSKYDEILSHYYPGTEIQSAA